MLSNPSIRIAANTGKTDGTTTRIITIDKGPTRGGVFTLSPLFVRSEIVKETDRSHIFDYFSVRYEFQTDDRTDKRHQKEKTPKAGRLLEKQNTHDHGAHSPDSCPHGISRADGQRFRRLDQ